MKSYPKIPRHDIEFVPSELFTADDLVVLEKLDGMNFRFILYEERFSDAYSDSVQELDPTDGDVIFATKSGPNGSISEPLDEYLPSYRDAIKSLREIDTDAIRDAHDQYGPLLWFGEHMSKQTIDYDYESDPPPTPIGFDIYALERDSRDLSDLPENKYKETFVGFLETDTAQHLFELIGIETAPVVQRGMTVNPDDFRVPESTYTDAPAEGVILRSDTLKRRAKLVTETFREMHKKKTGSYTQGDDPVDWFISAIVTPQRVTKHARRLVTEHGYDFSTDDPFATAVTQTVLKDSWEEEFVELQDISQEFAPADLHGPAHEQVRQTLDRLLQKNTGTTESITSDWRDKETTRNSTQKVSPKDISSVEKSVHQELTDDNSVEQALVSVILGRDEIEDTLDSLQNDREKALDGWVIDPATEKLMDRFWSGNADTLWQLHITFTPNAIQNEIANAVRETVEDIADVDLSSSSDTWTPDEANTEGLGELF